MKKLRVPLYLCNIHLSQVDEIEHEDPLVQGSLAYVEEFEDRLDMVFTKDITIGMIAHEAVHAAHIIFQSKGCTCDFENDEPLCYLVQWIVEECCKYLDWVK